MNKEIKAKWVAALRSGDYVQGKGTLRSEGNQLRSEGDQFCCLGVLCNLHAQAHPKIAAKQKDSESYMGESEILPDAVMEWSEVNTRNGLFGDDSGRSTLASLNDAGTSFSELAKIIEKHF